MSADLSIHKNDKNQNQKYKKILIMTAVEAEQKAVLKGLQEDSRFEVRTAGVGPVAAAVTTTSLLAKNKYDLVINAGIAGGFTGQAELESIVIANQILAADLGAETEDGFLPVEKLGFGFSRIPVDTILTEFLTDALKASGLAATSGAVLTVSTVTGTAESTSELTRRVPEAVAEAMEGFGVASAAQFFNTPFCEIRSISNAVGPRDKDAWKLKEALESLEKTANVLKEVL